LKLHPLDDQPISSKSTVNSVTSSSPQTKDCPGNIVPDKFQINVEVEFATAVTDQPDKLIELVPILVFPVFYPGIMLYLFLLPIKT